MLVRVAWWAAFHAAIWIGLAPLAASQEGNLDQRIEAMQQWIEESRGKTLTERDAFATLSEQTNLNGDLFAAGRIDEAVALCLAYADVVPEGLFCFQRALVLAAQDELGRQRLVEAEGVLLRLDTSLRAWTGDDAWVPLIALNRTYASIARAEVAAARGVLDGMRLHHRQAQVAVREASPESSGDDARAAVDRLTLDLYLANGDYERTRQVADELIAKWQQAGSSASARILPFEHRKLVAESLLALHHPSLLDGVRGRLEQLFGRLDVNRDRFDVAFRISDTSFAAGSVEEAHRWVRTARGLAETPLERAIVASLEGRHCADHAVPEHLAAWEHAFHELLSDWGKSSPAASGAGFLHYARRRFVLDAGIRMAMRTGVGGDARALTLYAATGQLSSLARRMGAVRTDLDIESLRQLAVLDGEVVLIPVLSRWGSYMIALTSDELAVVPTAPLPQFQAVVRPLQAMLEVAPPLGQVDQNARAGSFESLGRELYGLLVPKDIEALVAEANLVTFVDDGVVESIPIEVAHDGVGLLCTRYALAHIPSFHVEVALKRAPVSERHEAKMTLVLGTPARESEVDALAADLEPVELSHGLVHELLGPLSSSSTVLRGMDAVEERVGNAPFQDTRALELLVHGVLDDGRARSPVLVLGSSGAGDGLWACDEVEAMAAPPLVILATCGAGASKMRVGDGATTDLGGAFLYAGAEAVVIAANALPGEATIALLGELHRNLAAGATIAEGLRGARAAIRGEAATSDPYYFAQLRVVGRGEFIAFPAAATRAEWPGRKGAPSNLSYVLLAVVALVSAVLVTLLLRAAVASRRS